MNNFLSDFFLSNQILSITIVAWVFTQSVKVSLGILREKKFDFRWLIGTGGMPSSHAAGASALALSSGLDLGFSSPIFALAFVFALVTMFDAQGVRRCAGKQAQLLNIVMDDIYWQGKTRGGKLKELIGHTPIQVIIGSAIGCLIAIILN